MLKQRLPKFNYILVDDKDHCPQYSIDAVEVGRKFMEATSKMSEEEKTEYMKNFDFHSMGALDNKLLDKAFLLLFK